MKIKKIYIEKLFDGVNVVVDLPNQGNVNILYGQNGVGKTTVLQMVDALFNLRHKVFVDIPFATFKIELESGVFFQLNKRELKGAPLEMNPSIYSRRAHADMELIFSDGSKTFKVDFVKLNSTASRIPSWFRQTGPNTWLDIRTRSRYTTSEFVETYPRFSYLTRSATNNEERAKIDAIRDFLRINKTFFIETQRLVVPQLKTSDDVLPDDSEAKTNISVEVCAKKLIEKIRSVSLEYANVSQTLERTFPQRLIKHTSRYARMNNLLDKLNELESYRKELLDLGLSEPESVPVAPLKSAPEKFKNVLSLYLSDATDKLKVYRDLHRKVKLFMLLIGKRFYSKTMRVSVLKGIEFYSGKNQIPLPKLSSGEQHELIMIYNFLFEIPERSTVLIDEPEISLHVCWQEGFLKDLNAIGESVGHNFIVATHSPSIINENWGIATEIRNVNV